MILHLIEDLVKHMKRGKRKMNQAERRIYLIKYLLSEQIHYKGIAIPQEEQAQKDLLRSLVNVRPPRPVDQEFLNIQDAYLITENAKDGIKDLAELSPTKLDKQIYLFQGDITALQVDAIVNAANSQMCGCFRAMHNCVDNIIHTKAGVELRAYCNDMMQAQGHEEPAGQARITPAFNLPCKYVIHTVGPIVRGRLQKKHEELLASCYHSCLELAEKNGVRSVAFCCISTGVFMFPNERAAEIAVETVRKYYEETGSEMKVVFDVFKEEDLAIYSRILSDDMLG